jgi:hypothetical protein
MVDFSTWNPVMRISETVINDVATHVMRFNMNFRYNLLGSSYAQITIYIATLRKDAASRDPVAQPLQSGADFIVSSDFFNARLNPSIWHIRYARNITLTANTLFQPAFSPGAGGSLGGNPYSTFKKGNVTIKPNMKIRAPAQDFWKNMVPAQLPPTQRYYLITFIASNNTTNLAAGQQAYMDMDQLVTCKNTA